ncbi:MAG: hypothetical protein WC964_04245 [Acholeplasmataceae bacterium]
MLETVKNFILRILGSLDGFIGGIFKIDQNFFDLYTKYVVPLPEVVKVLGVVFLAIVIVLGVISFVKKLFKLFLVLAIILVIVFVLTRL